MTGSAPRRTPAALMASALTVGVVATVPAALLIVLGPAFGQALVNGASVAAAGVPLLLLAFVNWNLAVSVAVPAAVIALVAGPLVGRAPQQPRRTAG